MPKTKPKTPHLDQKTKHAVHERVFSYNMPQMRSHKLDNTRRLQNTTNHKGLVPPKIRQKAKEITKYENYLISQRMNLHKVAKKTGYTPWLIPNPYGPKKTKKDLRNFKSKMAELKSQRKNKK